MDAVDDICTEDIQSGWSYQEDSCCDGDLRDHEPLDKPSRHSNLADMFDELSIISKQLKAKHKTLTAWESSILEREQQLQVRETEIERAYEKMAFNLQRTVDQKHTDFEKKVRDDLSELQIELRAKTKETNRMRQNYDKLQEVNTQLRKQVEDLQEQLTKSGKQTSNLKQRLENLQRCQELREKQTENIMAELKTSPLKMAAKNKSKLVRPVPQTQSFTDVFVVIMDWTVKEILKPSFERGKLLDGSLRVHILDNCQRVLPSLADVIKDSASGNKKLCLPCLQFMYWSCLLLEQNPGKQNVGLSSTQRRIAEDLYKPLKPEDGEQPTAFVKSSDLQIRMLSYLLLLKTLTQVDCQANVLTLLKHDLRDELAKELFVHYHGSTSLLNYFKPTCKAHLGSVLDIYLLMCVESTMLRPFLTSCSTEAWFRNVSMVLKIPGLCPQHMEKISVILQKLSKLKETKKFFETFSLKSTIQELASSVSGADTGSFLLLNLKSVLYNLSAV